MAEGEVYESENVVNVVEETERIGQSLEMAIQRMGREEAWRLVLQYFDEDESMHNNGKTCRATYNYLYLFVFLTELL